MGVRQAGSIPVLSTTQWVIRLNISVEPGGARVTVLATLSNRQREVIAYCVMGSSGASESFGICFDGR
jgi:hypothetical protein